MVQTKKKRKQKNEDFKKTKLKVGKKKLQPDNHTDTSFKSKAIILPNQSVTVDKSQALTNHRNLTLKDLVSQTKHHNSAIRKEATFGIIELLDLHPNLLKIQTNLIIQTIARLINDSEAPVRKACLKLCSEKISTLAQDEIGPFLDLLMMVTCTAMTHIYEDVRDDSVMFLALWFKLDPLLARRYSSKLLPNFFSLLKISYNSKSSHQKDPADGFSKAKGQHWSSNSQIRILEHLHVFLSYLIKDRLSEDWYFQNFIKPGAINQVFSTYPNAVDLKWQEEGKAFPIYNSPMSILSNGSYENIIMSTKTESNENILISDAIIDLYPYLISTWVEACSSVFDNTSQINSVTPQLLTLNLTIRLLLWAWRFTEVIEREKLIERFLKFEKYVLPFFPFGKNFHVSSNAKLNSILNEMNASVAEITAIYLLKINDSTSSLDQAYTHSKDTSEDVSKYLMSILGKKSDMASKLSTDQLTSLLPSIWWFLNGDNSKSRQQLFNALISLARPDNSAVYLIILQFLHKIFILQTHPHSLAKFKLHSLPTTSINVTVNWLISLIKSLFVLKSGQYLNLDILKTTILIITHVIRFDPHNIIESNIEKIQAAFTLILSPIFNEDGANEKPLSRLIQLPEDVQEMFFQSFHHFNRLSVDLYNMLISLSSNSQNTNDIPLRFKRKVDRILSLAS